MKRASPVLGCLLLSCLPAVGAASESARPPLEISGTRFMRGGQPFPYTAVSFFNAIYNPAFNRDSAERQRWLAKFQQYGINVLRVWAQWDNPRPFVDAGRDKTLYHPDGRLRDDHLAALKAIIADADRAGMIIQLVLFSQESWHAGIRLAPEVQDRAVAALARELQPHRNVVLQIWNELSERVLEHVKTIKAIDRARLVTNSPGPAGFVGDPSQNRVLDYLTPHTVRQSAAPRHWEIAPKAVAYLLATYGKPVVDDEPARTGTASYGGPQGTVSPYDHIIQIQRMWELGAYVCYHHDMFQTGYGTPACPPSGIPDPEFSPYHRPVFDFLALRDRYMHRDTTPTPLP